MTRAPHAGDRATSTAANDPHVTGSASHVTGGAVDDTGNGSHVTGGAIHDTGNASRVTGSAVHATGSAVHATGNAMHATGNAMHATGNVTNPANGAVAPVQGATGPGEVLLEADGISKRFGGLQALSNVAFSIRRGEIYGLIGPNGAGKTSLFNVLTGIYAADAGRFVFDGEPLHAMTPDQVAKRGIARTFQNIRLFANLTALENVMIGRHVRTHAGVLGAIFRGARTRAEEAAIERRAFELLNYVGVHRRANDLARHLAYGDQRRLEIARALATDPSLLALDEPAAGMNATETAGLRALLEGIRRDGTTVLLIEHDMKLVMSVCDRVLVLDYGKKIAEGPAAQVQKDEKVIAAYLGGDVALHRKGT